MTDTDAGNPGSPDEPFSYDESILEVNEIIRKLQTNEIGVDGMIEAVGRGYELVNQCEAKLNRMDDEIRVLQTQPLAG